MADSPIVFCKASKSTYEVWIRFADGFEGAVDFSNLLDTGTFAFLRDRALFLTARPGEHGELIWPGAGVRLDQAVLRQAMEAEKRAFDDLDDMTEAARAEARSSLARSPIDPGFYRFMAQALAPVRRRR
jgi:hypothetical protein